MRGRSPRLRISWRRRTTSQLASWSTSICQMGGGTELLKRLDGIPVLALIKSLTLERQAEAIGLGADQVLGTTGPVEKIAAAVERLIGPRSIIAF